MSRRLAREYALQFIFSTDFNKEEEVDQLLTEFDEAIEASEDFGDLAHLSSGIKQFAKELIVGTLSKLEEIDAVIQNHAIGWKMQRIAKVDLAILRLALFEILYRDDIPESASANEAIELAKKYSTEESGSFINGILGKVIKGKNTKEV